MDSSALTPIRLNGRTVDLQRGSIADQSGHAIALRPQAIEVLKVLAARPGKIVTKDELMQTVWGNIAVTDDSLVQCVIEIRKALGDERHEIVRTLPKRGYVLEAEKAVEDSRKVAGARLLGLRSKSWLGLAAGLMILIGAAAAYLLPTTKSGAETPAIAVLPFENINGDERWDRFATGVTEDIITDLARYRDISVIARTSAEFYRGKAHDVREIGEALDVKYVLEGSLQVDGHRIRVTAQLIDAETGAHVWSERYDRLAAELLEVQDEITQKIATTLTGWQGQVTEAERTLARRKNATGLNAYDYWLLGIEAKHRMTVASQLEARAYFEKGLNLAPDFMPLVRDMGITYAIEMDIGSVIDFPAWVDAQRKYAERALALDPNDSTANFTMAVAYAYQNDSEQAERYQKLALQFGPNNADTMMQLAWTYAGWQTERALELVERTLKLNPRYPSWWNFPITQTYFAARQFDEAYTTAKQLGESPSQAAFVAMSAAQIGKKQEAAAAAAKVLRMKPDWTAESMFPYQGFKDDSVLSESAAKAGLPVCMTVGQAKTNTGMFRMKQCEAERVRAALN
ncbi:tetratricopeptide repeat protein [Mesorhizobium sp. M6A.T.Ce.TU.002.03.1.1]|uniref:winged helix-turn-helix domain-containing tetratricopeptide repeat protein n=1 Tax=Mesorhizobium sp. M6A.T.Ce.TU.002.03.1.1 TaxID=2496782 RepID=UPI000FCA08FB|nr:winged helix-turn-helix domain-containing protein [Mesorhizobium sp. M6A.T.Ce.TU.002.03.1.1]RUU44264.1 tetratricopeptide repeat protein [Mesorhizobium sp. M6A.T.Ce.TU.002.03.1.1]